MGLFNRKQKVEEQPSEKRNTTFLSPILGGISFIGTTSNYTKEKNLKISAVYRCVNLLSDSIASMPIVPYNYKDNWKYIDYDSGIYDLLNTQPNNIQSAYIFKKMIVQLMLLKGNAYILINRNSRGIQKLTLIPNEQVEIIIDNGDIKYKNTETGVVYDKSQIIHIMNYTENGIYGVSTLEYASQILELSYNSDNHATGFFKGGANLAGILSPKQGENISPEKAENAKTEMVNSLDNSIGGKSNSVVVLDRAFEFVPVNISPKDSQLLETRTFNVQDIARFFNVPTSLLYVDSGKYSTSEQQQLDFLTNSLTPLIEKIENELFRKLYLKSEWKNKELRFDSENLLRLDATTRASYFTQLFNLGALTPNEIREKINAKYPVKNGNRPFVLQNAQPLDNILNDIKSGDNPTVNNNNNQNTN